MKRLPAGMAMVAGCALLVAACSPGGQTAAPLVAASPTSLPTSSAPSSAPTPSPITGPTQAGAVGVDASLLSLLPSMVDGLPLTESAEAEATALRDPQLSTVGSAVAAGIAVDGTTGEFVYAVVVRLKPAAMSDDAFGRWRAAYDEGACAQAGGVVGSGKMQIAGRDVYTGTCVGGLRTYHVWLAPQGFLIAVSAVGDRLLGERLLEHLQP